VIHWRYTPSNLVQALRCSEDTTEKRCCAVRRYCSIFLNQKFTSTGCLPPNMSPEVMHPRAGHKWFMTSIVQFIFLVSSWFASFLIIVSKYQNFACSRYSVVRKGNELQLSTLCMMMKVSSQYHRLFRRTSFAFSSLVTKRSASDHVLLFGDAGDILAFNKDQTLAWKNVTLTKRTLIVLFGHRPS
jgi:hypothetical protein